MDTSHRGRRYSIERIHRCGYFEGLEAPFTRGNPRAGPIFAVARRDLKRTRLALRVDNHTAARGHRIEAVENAEHHGVKDVDVEEPIDERDQ